MSTLLSAQSIHFQTSSTILFEALSFTLRKGDRIGLVGHNGCGKSTLLQLLYGSKIPSSGEITVAKQCLMERVEQSLPQELENVTLMNALLAKLPEDDREQEQWRVELLLAEIGFSEQDWGLNVGSLSGGQHTRLLLSRAIISQPDLLLLDEPSNHLDLPTLLWLEHFLLHWQGSFVLVSHDRRLLDKVTNCTWILRDKTLNYFQLPCSAALTEQERVDEAARLRNLSEQKEINRVEQSAKRLANWGRVYDNEDLARKAKTMERRVERLKESQTELTSGTPWQLSLKGERLNANQLVTMSDLGVVPARHGPQLFSIEEQMVKSGDRIAIVGRNGCGKSSLLKMLWQHCIKVVESEGNIRFHPRCRVGFYDQSLKQLHDDDTLIDALDTFTNVGEEARKIALISAGFEYSRHSQFVGDLSGGERSRLLMLALSLAQYHLLMLDEPTNHLDLNGKEQLASTLNQFDGGILVVTHDRELIEKSCNRFWLIQDGLLTEWHDLEKLYSVIDGNSTTRTVRIGDSISQSVDELTQQKSEQICEETLLEQLCHLETLLEEDLKRKPKHQKPNLQHQWREEITRISQLLSLEL